MGAGEQQRISRSTSFGEYVRLGMARPISGQGSLPLREELRRGGRHPTSLLIQICRLAESHIEMYPGDRGFLIRPGCMIDWYGHKHDAIRILVHFRYRIGATVDGLRISASRRGDGGLVFEKPWGHPSGQVAEKSWFDFSKEEAAEVHKQYIRLSRERAKKRFRVTSYLRHDEEELLRRYWLWMKALADGEIPPLTKAQVRFVRVATTFDTPPESELEWLWSKCAHGVEVG